MTNKLSVIIPAFNAAKTIEATVLNVMASTLPLDIWVVDDGSSDETGSILDRLVENRRNSKSTGQTELHVIHQTNCGAYQARLAALRKIQTPYFGFVDADDMIEPLMFEKLVMAIEEFGLDAVQCEVVGQKVGKTGLEIIEGRDLVQHKYRYLVNSVESCFIWDKVYRHQYDFSNFVLTDHVTNYDDMIFNFQFFSRISRFGILHEQLYHYQYTPGSAVHSIGPRQQHDFMWMMSHHFSFSKKLFLAGEYSNLHLLFGHVMWRFRNLRNNIIGRIRVLLQKIFNYCIACR